MTKGYLLLLAMASLFTIEGCANIEQRDERLSSLEFQINAIQKAQAALNVRVEELNSKVALLEEKVRENAREIQDIQSMAIPAPPGDLKVVKLLPQNERVEEITSKEGKVVTENPDELYNVGYTLFTKGDMEGAREVLNRFLKDFPQHPLSDNAQYWIGETYYTERNYAMALEGFQKVVDNYPHENKAPDALLKIAFSLMELGKEEEARDSLKKLIKIYPLSEAARMAEDTLLKMR